MALLTSDENDMPLHRLWTASEVAFDLGLAKFGIRIDMEAEDVTKFVCYEEAWEADAIKNKLNLNEFKLLQKYKDVRFYDDDEEQIFKVISTNLDWKKKDKQDKSTPCYVLLAKPVREEEGEEEGSDNGDESIVSYHINDFFFDMVKDSRSEHPSNFQLVTEP